MSLKKTLSVFFLSLAVIAGVFFAGYYYGNNLKVCDVCEPSEINFSLFWTAYNELKDKFVDPSKITDENILYGAITGMAESLGDPYTTFFKPVDAKKFNDELSGYFSGIGMEIATKKDELTIVSPLEGTPAQEAGLRAGDKILKIGDKDSVTMSPDEAATLIRGEAGTEVTLTIFRPTWEKPKEIKITRAVIKIPTRAESRRRSIRCSLIPIR